MRQRDKMSQKGKKSSIWKLLLESQRIVLTTHVRPDGDGLASELALYLIMKSLGKKIFIVNQDRTPEIYTWLPEAQVIHTCEQYGDCLAENIDLAVLLDCSSPTRIGKVYDFIKNSARIVSIDHHENPDCFGEDCYIDTKASSIGEILYTIIPDIEKYLTKDVATCIYTSILTDTGSFAYANTTAGVFKIASHLVKVGVCPDSTYSLIYNNKRITHFHLLAKALKLLKTEESGKIVHTSLPLSVYRETGALEEDNEGILEVIKGLKNVELILLLRQLDEKRLKVSLRSTNNVNCNVLARLYGGGGHSKASGFVIPGDVQAIGGSVVETIVTEVKKREWI